MTFQMWSLFHFAFILLPFVSLIVFMYFTKNKTYEQKRKLGIIVSLIGVLLLVLRNAEIFANEGWSAELLPLQICHFANFVLLFAFLKDNKPMFALAFALNLPAAFASIVFANGLENYATLICLRGIAYILGHALIVFLTLWAWLSGFVVINKGILSKTILIMLILYISAVVVNNLLVLTGITPNYFYTLRPENGTPLEIFFKWGTTVKIGFLEFNPVYLFLSAIFGFIVVVIFYGLYLLHKYLVERKEYQK